ncbi:hypothetical protein GCM10025882_36090 [Acinetobacter gyllenbergii]|uniref:Uncharacterized protein n=1 Tax=Acinetobacter gyllenbergii CIP 110306 = MTCC 11365 TaxID=1217657 RepID=A0A829HIY2_9GAMM|nr:hypothetical protein [Acinetobacter gyllenbergii]EPF90630.1 hypothetical protein F957_00986 [Acinetobacter gyllenbergii CIP 110306 = MTCC 11365]EPH33939.1 hypothetical protein L293_3710 [Acinetobacter gyllenbergii CIP 110306 = MTCC 11365]ESK35535.1 hypothetical protein F987_04114 [Acinetobacter gyllenbergii NIPH 230]OBY73971.1 hypothetical protein NG55_12385 [Acinetobacter gyllenbergii]GMA13183.1 hypothetical protein GCM10025882_36090 [Acinetobacter gyllenbergii]
MIIGLILHYSSLNKAGIVIDENSVRYQFSSEEWREDIDLKLGFKVTFDLNQYDQVTNIRKEWLTV